MGFCHYQGMDEKTETTKMENQVEKNMEHEIQARNIWWLIGTPKLGSPSP